MTTKTCSNCGFIGEIIHFKNGPRGRKIHDECQRCRNEMANLINHREQLFTYLVQYENAYNALIFGADVMNRFRKFNLTPSYAAGGEYLGSMHDTHFVPIAHLAFQHAESDVKAGINLIREIDEALGPIISITPNMKLERRVMTREEIRACILLYESIPTGMGELSKLTIKVSKKKNILRRLFGI